MKASLVLLISFFSITSFASTVGNTKITHVLLGEVYGDIVFIGIETKPSFPSGHCNTHGIYNYVFNPTTEIGKATLSVVLAAYAAQKPIYINGYDTCNLYGSVETLRQIRLQ